MLNEMSMNHDMRPFSLLINDSIALLNAELNNTQTTKCTYLKDADSSASERSEIKETIRT
jgi:hypothetical protein